MIVSPTDTHAGQSKLQFSPPIKAYGAYILVKHQTYMSSLLVVILNKQRYPKPGINLKVNRYTPNCIFIIYNQGLIEP